MNHCRHICNVFIISEISWNIVDMFLMIHLEYLFNNLKLKYVYFLEIWWIIVDTFIVIHL
jgi:hypothetical protein